MSLLLFQNCSGTGAFSSIDLSSLSLKESGNGTGYGGKPEGSYYRFLPDYRCDGQFTAAASISPNADGSMTFNSCGQAPVVLDPKQIVTSPFETQFIVYDDFLYSRYDVKPDGIPSNLAELLCRDNFTDPRLELVAHYDRATATANLDFYGDPQLLQGISTHQTPSRVYSNQSISYKAENLSINVDLGTTGATPKQFLGVLTLGTASVKITCVTGAGLDASAWPIQKEIPDPMNWAEIFPQTAGKILVTSAAKDLIMYDQDQKAQSLIALLGLTHPMADGYYNAQHWMNPEKDEMVVIDRYEFSKMNFHFYYVNLKNPQRIEIPLPSNPETGTTAYQLTTFYKSSILIQGYINTSDGFQTQALYEFNTQTLKLQKLLEAKNWRQLSILKNPDRLVFTSDDGVMPKIHVLGLEDLSLQSYTISQFGISDVKYFMNGSSFFSTGKADELLYTNFKYQYLNNANVVNSQVLKLNLSTGATELLARDVAPRWQKPGSSLFVLCDLTWQSLAGVICKDGFHQLLDLDTGRVSELTQPLYGIGADANYQQLLALTFDGSGNVYSLSRDPSGKAAVVQISQEQKNTLPICRGLSDTVIKMLEGQDNRAYLFTKNEAAQSFRMYRVEGGVCQLLNQFPLQSNVLNSVVATAKGFGVSIQTYDNTKLTSIYDFKIGTQLVFMPIDGQAPILLNPRSKGVVTLELISPSQDGKLIYLRGLSEADNKTYLYSFRIP